MTAKEYLEQLKILDTRLRQDYKQLEEARKLEMINGIDYSKPRVKTSLPNGLDGPIACLVDWEERLHREIESYIRLKEKIISQIRGMENPVYEQVLFKRYIESKGLRMIAAELGYSHVHTCRLHGMALEEFKIKYGSAFNQIPSIYGIGDC